MSFDVYYYLCVFDFLKWMYTSCVHIAIVRVTLRMFKDKYKIYIHVCACKRFTALATAEIDFYFFVFSKTCKTIIE